MGDDVAQQLGAMVNKADAKEIQRVLNEIDLNGLAVLQGDFQAVYEAIAKDGAIVALAQIGVSDEKIVELVNEKAVEWAKQAGAEMVGMKYNDAGKLVKNPNPRWRIDEATRSMLRATVKQAIDEGWSNDRMAGEIAGSHAFGGARAEMIARTETALADVQGNMIAYRESGVVKGKEWLTAADCCELCAEIDGKVVGLDDAFLDSVLAPPYHPNCRCDCLPVLVGANDKGK